MLFDDKTCNIDINRLEDLIKREKPTLVILGWSEFLFPHPLELIRQICDRYSARILHDRSHVAGLIAGGYFQPEAVRYADVVTSSKGKSLFSANHGLIMFNDDSLQPAVLWGYRYARARIVEHH